MMNSKIFSVVLDEHARFSRMINLIDQTAGTDSGRELFFQLKKDFILHTRTEEATIYAAVRELPATSFLIHESKDEHQDLRDYLNQLSNLDKNHPRWRLIFNQFRSIYDHHIEIEEAVLLRLMYEQFEPKLLTELGRKYLAFEKDLIRLEAA